MTDLRLTNLGVTTLGEKQRSYRPVMTFLDDQAQNIRVYTDNGTMDLSATELQNKDLLMARISSHTCEAMASKD